MFAALLYKFILMLNVKAVTVQYSGYFVDKPLLIAAVDEHDVFGLHFLFL